ncbi:uncharacterized protein ISCGN_003805 [Ixodes scapularis]
MSHCGVYLQRPNTTRWNSLHDAMEHLLKLHEEGKDLDRLLCNLKLQVFNRPTEYKFMEEYCNVMKPLSCALDVLQRQEHMFIGYLLPTLAILEKRIKYEAMKGLAYCGPLANSVLTGIEKRFGHLKGKRDLVISSCLIPRFKLSWIEDGSMRDQASNYLKTELASVTSGAMADVAVSSTPEDFFSLGQQTLQPEAQDELSRYLLVPVDHPLSQMKSFEGLHRLFLKYNTAVPSSASVERLFSVANEVLTKKRARLADSNIEKQLLLSSNKELC